jgi:hypothetical protein
VADRNKSSETDGNNVCMLATSRLPRLALLVVKFTSLVHQHCLPAGLNLSTGSDHLLLTVVEFKILFYNIQEPNPTFKFA